MMLNPGDVAVDYAYARPAPARIVDAGVRLVVRYISPTRANGKNLTAAERDALHAAGLSILVVWENSATDPLKGGALGKVHGIQATNFAKDLGYPPDTILIVAVDFDVQPAQMATVIAYLSAFASLCPYPLWVYGKDTVVDAAVNAGVCVGGWQTVAWSHHRVSPNAFVLQHATPVHPDVVAALAAVDDNTVLRPFKAWSTAPDPAPIQLQGDPDMAAAFFEVESLPGQYVWSPGQDPVAFASINDRDVLLHGLGVDPYAAGAGGKISLEQYNRLFAPKAAAPVVDYHELAKEIAPLLPTTFDGSIHLSAAG